MSRRQGHREKAAGLNPGLAAMPWLQGKKRRLPAGAGRGKKRARRVSAGEATARNSESGKCCKAPRQDTQQHRVGGPVERTVKPRTEGDYRLVGCSAA